MGKIETGQNVPGLDEKISPGGEIVINFIPLTGPFAVGDLASIVARNGIRNQGREKGFSRNKP